MRLVAIAVGLLVLTWVASAVARPIALDGQVVVVDRAFDVLDETDGRMSIDAVRAAADRFEPIDDAPQLPPVGHPVRWHRLELEGAPDKYVIDVSWAANDVVDAWVERGDELTHYAVGPDRPLADRPYYDPNPAIPVVIAPGQPTRVYVRFWDDHAAPLSASIRPEGDYRAFAAWRLIWHAAWLGFALVMALYNLMMFIGTRQREFGSYALYVLGIGGTQWTVLGFHLFVSAGALEMQRVMNGSLMIYMGAMVMFIAHFIDAKQHHPRVYRMLLGLSIACALMLVPSIVWASSSAQQLFSVFLPNSVQIAVLVAVVVAVRRDPRGMMVFAAAWVILLIGTVIFILPWMRVMEATPLSRESVLIGSAIEFVLLGLALAARLNRLKAEREAALEGEVAKERSLRELRGEQARLVHDAKMRSLAQLVAGVAHDMNTPMGSIDSSSATLARALDKLEALAPDAPDKKRSRLMKVLRNATETVQTAGTRVTATVSKLRGFAKLDEADTQAVDINDCVNDTVAMLGTTAAIETQLGDLPKLHCHPRQINQALLQVLTNAVQAIDDDGAITITTAHDDDAIVVIVADDGEGIDPELLEEIFEPGFTTARGVGVGSGLGLAIADRIVRDHEGTITAESAVGDGATFTLRFPVSPTPAGHGDAAGVA